LAEEELLKWESRYGWLIVAATVEACIAATLLPAK